MIDAAMRRISRPCAPRVRLPRLALPAAGASEGAPEPQASSTFQTLLGRPGVESHVGLRLDTSRNTQGRGIFIDQDVAKGTVLLEMPLDACIAVDYAGAGLVLPQDVPRDGPAWPRLAKAVSKDDALPWDILISLALLDSMSGMGSQLFQSYANSVFPGSSELSLPLCLPPSMLLELQDADLASKALLQKDRLRDLFPGLAVPVDADDADDPDGGSGPTWMEYAFACVRSRAFSLGKDRFAFVPILDAANHALEPNADFTYSPADGGKIVLFALEDAMAGDEVTISYTGRVGYKNKRLFAQYGFVLEEGNPFDTFDLEEDLGVQQGSTILALGDVQKALGDGDFMVNTFSGKDTYSYASLKSLPIDADDRRRGEQRTFLESVRRAVSERIDRWQSSLRDDESMLEHMLRGTSDGRLVAVVRYRVQAKKRDVACLRLVETLLFGNGL
jgi:hypothetical protein